MEAILEAEGLSKSYRGFSLHDVSFSLPCGSILGLIGENGAGKSTTIHAVLGMIRHGGTVRLFGQDAARAGKALRERVGAVFGEDSFPPGLCAAQLSRVLGGIFRAWDAPLFRELLARFGVPETKPVQALSRGMRLKLNLAAALAHHPSLLVLDEATAGLDPVVRDDVLDILLDFVQDERRSVLVSSHITADLEKIADSVVFLHRGTVLLQGGKDALLDRFGLLRCTQAQFERVSPADYLYRRRLDCEWDLLVPDRTAARRLYPDCALDRPTLDDLLLLAVKGHAPEKPGLPGTEREGNA